MGNPFSETSITNYNSNPPPDDGSTGSNNIVAWSTIKTKLPDPIKTAFDTSQTATNSAFAKIIGGGGFTTVSTDYDVLAADQGKFVRATASGITITTPDATSVGAPFVFIVLNNSSGSITVAGNNPGVQQDIDGSVSLTLPAGAGLILNTDGTNWYTGGQQGILAGKQLAFGDIVNATIAESNSTNAVTFSLKTLAGADPSSTDPVLLCFRNATAGTGNYVYRQVTGALSIVVSAGSTLGTANNGPCRLWIVAFDDAGTIRLGVINQVNVNNYYAKGMTPVASSTAEGGAGGADSAGVFYTGTAVTSKPFVIIGYADYNSGISTAGNWNVDPDTIQLMGGDVPKPAVHFEALYQNQVTSNTAGPTYTSAGWRTVILNTEAYDPGNIGALSSNQVTLQAGIYSAEGVTVIGANGSSPTSARVRLRNVTDSATLDQGIQLTSPAGANNNLVMTVFSYFTLTAPKAIEFQVYPSVGAAAPAALNSGDVEIYATLLIKRLGV